ncbi:MAG: 2,3,4,5-tetrahydropyridine-2,6-dicarboxylate N-succinyltransferase, partial [Thiotrichaceae bacterium IS1]
MEKLKSIIESAFDNRADLTIQNASRELKEAITETLHWLDSGKVRVAEKLQGQWIVHQWLKKAVLLSFRLEDNYLIKGGFTNYYDKVAPKFADVNTQDFRQQGVR